MPNAYAKAFIDSASGTFLNRGVSCNLVGMAILLSICIGPACAQGCAGPTRQQADSLDRFESEGLRMVAAELRAPSVAVQDDWAERRIDLFRSLAFYVDGIIRACFPQQRGTPDRKEIEAVRQVDGGEDRKPQPLTRQEEDLIPLRLRYGIYAALGGEYATALDTANWLSAVLSGQGPRPWHGSDLLKVSEALRAEVSSICANDRPVDSGPAPAPNPESALAFLEAQRKGLLPARPPTPSKGSDLCRDSSLEPLNGLPVYFKPFGFAPEQRRFEPYFLKMVAGTSTQERFLRIDARLESASFITRAIELPGVSLLAIEGAEGDARAAALQFARARNAERPYIEPGDTPENWNVIVNLSREADAHDRITSALLGLISPEGVFYEPLMRSLVVADPWFGPGAEATRASAMRMLIEPDLRSGFTYGGARGPRFPNRTRAALGMGRDDTDAIVPPIALALEHAGPRQMEDDYRLYELKEALRRNQLPPLGQCLGIRATLCRPELCEAVQRYFAIYLASRRSAPPRNDLQVVLHFLRKGDFTALAYASHGKADEFFRTFIERRSERGISPVWRDKKQQIQENFRACDTEQKDSATSAR